MFSYQKNLVKYRSTLKNQSSISKMDSKYVKIILRWLEAEIFNFYQKKIANEQ